MATQNRGTPSATNSNTRPNGVNRSHDDSFTKTDYKTLRDMQIANMEVMKILKDITGSKSLKGFAETVDKLSNTLIKANADSNKQQKEIAKKLAIFEEGLTKEIKERENKKGNAIDIAQAYQLMKNSKEYKEFQAKQNFQLKELQEKAEEEAKKTRREIIKQSFKNNTESKEIKYLDSKFSKGNHLASVSNDYYGQLEKLKISALETYGEGFENNKGYKKALLNLNDTYAKDMKDAWKEDFKENHKILGGIAEGIKDTFDRNKEALQGILGPLNLFIEPLKNFFGGFGMAFKFIGGGIKRIFGKFTKKNPNANDVLKTGAYGVGSLYIGHKLDELFGTTKDKGLNLSSFGNTFEKLKDTLGVLNKAVTSFGTIASVAGLTMIVTDAIKGFNKSEEWGTDKVSSILGAIIGGVNSGGSGAVHGAIKYALLGAPFGIAGILIGGIMGGILGYFGGEFWAEGIQDAKDWLSGDKNKQNDLMKKNLLNDVEKKHEKGQISNDYYNAMKNLYSVLDTEDYVKLGTKGTLQEQSNLLLSGKFDSLSNKELNSLVNSLFGISIEDKNGLENFKNILKWTSTNISSEYLKDIYKDPKMLGDYLKNYIDLQNALQSGGKKSIKTSLDKLGYSKEVIDFILSDIENLTNSSYGGFSFSSNKNNKNKTLFNPYAWGKEYESIDDAIIRTDGSIIKTNPKDTLVALKDVSLSMDKVRENANKNLNGSLGQMGDNALDKKLTTIIDVLSKILEKDIQLQLPPQTRSDLDMIMSGGMI